MREEIRNWIEQAKRDLKSAENSLKSKDYYLCAFMCQQAAEKGLKALIIKKEKKLIKMHDLVILGRKIGLPENLLLNCEKLSKVYIESRYGILENEPPYKKFKEKDALEFIFIAKEILEWLKKKI